MKETTAQAIHAALLKGPRTQPQLVAATGLNRSTVIAALAELRIGWLPNTWPRQYALGDDVPALPGDPDSLTVPRRPLPPVGWGPRWNGARAEFAGHLSGMTITPDSDPRTLADEFESGASTLASIAEALREVAVKPDWYALIGGDDTPANVTPLKKVKKSIDKPLSTT